MFSTEGSFAQSLHGGAVSENLRKAFSKNGSELSDDLLVHLKSSDKKVDVVEEQKSVPKSRAGG